MKAIAWCPGWHGTDHGVNNSSECKVQATPLREQIRTLFRRWLQRTGPRSVATGHGRAKQFAMELDDLRD